MRSLVGVSFGHNDNFNKGANGFLNEDVVNAQVGKAVINLMEIEGLVDVVHLFKDNVKSFTDSVNYRPLLANDLKCTLIIDIHHNSFTNEKANGSEVLTMSEEGEKCGLLILNEMVKLGYYNRGNKYNSLAFNRLSTMPSIIFEGFFISNKADCNKYNIENEARAIVNGIYAYLGLYIEAKPKRCYIVIKGDTLYGIAKKIGTTIDDLVEQNNIADRNKIFVGQKLFY